ncbi:hypothetical protein CFBP7900_38380 [Xanthomonas hortorum pv. carotae]|uniref:Uncharacterized protein n=1 Tax=Xanthomonas hortorum pv. carotae TaxID=487904 RepID=A0A6V7FGX6_9XANT|nr:hypothetical protein CFBP7900_38380 [Xanthomonas hortorum pv. carotae]CAD0362781.1 hypothetical protein CFBP7900_38380 [Xanthomonas hortorum pv. carotae]
MLSHAYTLATWHVVKREVEASRTDLHISLDHTITTTIVKFVTMLVPP